MSEPAPASRGLVRAPSSSACPTPLGGNSPTASATSSAIKRSKPLTLLPLVVLIFFGVSGGPFGTEDAVTAGGPLLVLVGFLVLPLVWSVPEALITAELTTAFPENSGFVAWVTAAFGPFWGFQEGLWSWLSGVTDNSLYPVLFAASLKVYFPALDDGWPRFAFVTILSLALSFSNYRGLTVVGHTAVTSTILILVPFLLLSILCIPHMEVKNWTRVDWPNVNWGQYLNIMFWCLNYWDSVSTLAGEVRDPARTLPRALGLAIPLVVAFYLIPTAAALGVTPDVGDWELGYYGTVALKVGGHWLAVWIVVASGCSQVGMYQAEMATDSYMVAGMAERGFLPLALAKRSKHGTPTVGIILSSVGVLGLATFDFVDIVTLLNAIYCMAELLEIAAVVWLRIKAPNMVRPYRVPLGTFGLAMMLLPASILLVVVLALPFVNGDRGTMAMTCGAVVLGVVAYPVLQLARRRGWCEFAPLHFECDGVYTTAADLAGGAPGGDDAESVKHPLLHGEGGTVEGHRHSLGDGAGASHYTGTLDALDEGVSGEEGDGPSAPLQVEEGEVAEEEGPSTPGRRSVEEEVSPLLCPRPPV